MEINSIKRVAVLGSGAMGKQLALLCASANIEVVLWNHVKRPESASDLHRIAQLEARRGIFPKENLPLILEQITNTDDLSSIGDADIFLETIVEDFDIKRSLLEELTDIIGSETIVATNTSTLSVSSLSAGFPFASRFMGTHFFNPPLSTKLVEVVRGCETEIDSINRILAFLSTLQKHPVVMAETPGNVVNRLLFSLINEAVHLLGEGKLDATTIDSCMKLGALHPMGPLELADFIGLDVSLKILETLASQTNDLKFKPARLLKEAVAHGRLGRKSGAGFHIYRKRPACSLS